MRDQTENWKTLCEKWPPKKLTDLAAVALRHQRHAPADLAELSNYIFESLMPSTGFRSFRNLKRKSAVKILSSKMDQEEFVASAVIALWASSNQQLLEQVRQRVTQNGHHFDPEWTWQTGLQGFIEIGNEHPLALIEQEMTEKVSEYASNDIHLAILWLSSGFVEGAEQTALQESVLTSFESRNFQVQRTPLDKVTCSEP